MFVKIRRKHYTIFETLSIAFWFICVQSLHFTIFYLLSKDIVLLHLTFLWSSLSFHLLFHSIQIIYKPKFPSVCFENVFILTFSI